MGDSEKANKVHDEQLKQFIQSCNSLNDFSDGGLKTFLPHITAAVIAILYHVVVGVSFAYSATLIPQLMEAQNGTAVVTSNVTIVKVTESDIPWIASVLPTVVLPASVVGGFLIDYIGRLNTLKLASIPNALGWILIATAWNVPMLVVGRMLTGTSIALGVSPAIIYTTEISTPKIRGALVSIGPCFVSVGMLVGYLEGWFLHWRTVAWTCLIQTLVPIAFVILWLPESPTWLVSKNKIEQARKSLNWFNRYRKPEPNQTRSYSEVQLALLQKDHILKQDQSITVQRNQALEKCKIFLKPTVYKPMLILSVLYFFQQFSGLFIILFYAVSFFDAVGTNMGANFASVLVGVVRVLMAIVAIILTKRFTRRSLIIVSGIGMGLSISVSGFFTYLITEEKTTLNWIPTAMILLYVATSMIGFLGIPWTIIGELYPTGVRGICHSITFGIANIIMFVAIQLYFTLIRLFGGLANLQYFFAIMSFSGALFSYIFLPETHNKKLSEIEEYFEQHSTYFSYRRSQMKFRNVKLESPK